MVCKRVVKVERKTFILAMVKDWLRIEERGRGWASSVDLPRAAVVWLSGKLKSLTTARLKAATAGSRSFSEFDLVLTVKTNKVGWYLSILCLHRLGDRGRNIICVPLRSDGNGGKISADVLEKCFKGVGKGELNNRFAMENKLRTMEGDVQNFKSGSGFTKRSQFLRNNAAVVETDVAVNNWSKVDEELYQALKLRARFSLLAISHNCALLEFALPDDQKNYLIQKKFT